MAFRVLAPEEERQRTAARRGPIDSVWQGRKFGGPREGAPAVQSAPKTLTPRVGTADRARRGRGVTFVLPGPRGGGGSGGAATTGRPAPARARLQTFAASASATAARRKTMAQAEQEEMNQRAISMTLCREPRTHS